MDAIRLVIADDHAFLVRNLCEFLQKDRLIDVVGIGQNDTETIRLNEAFIPDVLILGLLIGESNGIEVIQRLRAANSRVQIIVLANPLNQKLSRALEYLGVAGILSKDAQLGEIAEAIKKTARNKKRESHETR